MYVQETAPTWHRSRFQKFEPHVFHSSPSAVCLQSLVEIRSTVLEKSPMKDERRAQVLGWVQIRQRFSGMAWPIFVRFYHPIQNLCGQNQTALFFRKIPLFSRQVGCSVGRSTPKVTFLLSTLQISEASGILFLLHFICRTHEKFGLRSVQRIWSIRHLIFKLKKLVIKTPIFLCGLYYLVQNLSGQK